MFREQMKKLSEIGKPILHVKDYEINKIEDKLFYVMWQGKKDNQTIVAHSIEEKDGVLITDDFIFIKED